MNKQLVAASAEPLILALLALGESYGYSIIQEIRRRSGGNLVWTDGMLYPVLHRLESRGWISARWVVADGGRKRKYYALAKAGRQALKEQNAQWDAVNATLAALRKN